MADIEQVLAAIKELSTRLDSVDTRLTAMDTKLNGIARHLLTDDECKGLGVPPVGKVSRRLQPVKEG